MKQNKHFVRNYKRLKVCFSKNDLRNETLTKCKKARLFASSLFPKLFFLSSLRGTAQKTFLSVEIDVLVQQGTIHHFKLLFFSFYQ